jgi:hypothetical protein
MAYFSTVLFGCSGFVFFLIGVTFLAMFFNQVPSLMRPTDNLPVSDPQTVAPSPDVSAGEAGGVAQTPPPTITANDWISSDTPQSTPRPLLDIAMDVPTYIWYFSLSFAMFSCLVVCNVSMVVRNVSRALLLQFFSVFSRAVFKKFAEVCSHHLALLHKDTCVLVLNKQTY